MNHLLYDNLSYSDYEPTTRERTLRSVSKPYFVEGGHPSGRLVTRALLQFIRKSTEPNRLWHFEECFSLFNPALEEGTWLPALWCMVLSSLTANGSLRTQLT